MNVTIDMVITAVTLHYHFTKYTVNKFMQLTVRSDSFNPLQKLIQSVGVFLNVGSLCELVETKCAQELTVDTSKLVQIHRAEVEFLDCPVSPTPHVIFSPGGRICVTTHLMLTDHRECTVDYSTFPR